MHGDERFGAQVIEEALHETHPIWETSAAERVIHFIIGNPEALRQGQRARSSGLDLNRLFGDQLDGPGPEHAYEEERVKEIKAVLQSAKVLIDIHQTSCPSPSVAVIPHSKEHRTLAHVVGVEIGVLGAQDTYGPKMISDWFNNEGGVGITIETGQIGDEAALSSARRVLSRFLGTDWHLGPNTGSIHLYQIREGLQCPGGTFRWSVALGNTSTIKGGEIIATSDAGPLIAPSDSATFLPQRSPSVGETCVLLADDLGRRPTWCDDL